MLSIKDVDVLELDKIRMEKLIDYLTKEVVKNLKGVGEKKDEILVIREKEDKKEIKSDQFKLVYQDECELEKLNTEDYKHMIITSLTLNQLVSIGIGKAEDAITSLIIECILKNKNVSVLNDGIGYRKYKTSSNENFYKMIENYEKTIISYGIRFIDENDIDLIYGKNKKVLVEDDPIDHKIITESLLEKRHRKVGNTIRIRKNAIITPLANDYIRTNNIKILKE